MIHDVIARWRQHVHGEPGVLEELLDAVVFYSPVVYTPQHGKYVNGVDIIRVNDSGRIVEFRVMVRPLQAVNAVHRMMGAQLDDLNH